MPVNVTVFIEKHGLDVDIFDCKSELLALPHGSKHVIVLIQPLFRVLEGLYDRFFVDNARVEFHAKVVNEIVLVFDQVVLLFVRSELVLINLDISDLVKA